MDISEEELRENFDHFDRNNDGKLSREEFGELMEALGAVQPDSYPSRGFSSIDTDGSGGIEFDEFALWFRDQ
ncbi:MAG: EF-hand domain-containing protein [Pseudomonadota bacterium]